ncbi:MAG: hypothetical protein R2765_01775 [Ferruginibacter sp.]
MQECLLLQLERMRDAGKNVDMAIRVLEKYFDEFTKTLRENTKKP